MNDTANNTTNEFCELMTRIRDGCPEAMDLVCRRYDQAIRIIVRRKFRKKFRSQYDSIDIVQDVWASIARVPLDDFVFQSSEDLVRYLARLATNKVIDNYRRNQAQRNAYERDQNLESLSIIPGREPTPSQNAMADERFQRIIDNLSPGQRTLITMRRQGFTHEDIANRLGLQVKAVQRVLRTIERNLN